MTTEEQKEKNRLYQQERRNKLREAGKPTRNPEYDKTTRNNKKIAGLKQKAFDYLTQETINLFDQKKKAFSESITDSEFLKVLIESFEIIK